MQENQGPQATERGPGIELFVNLGGATFSMTNIGADARGARVYVSELRGCRPCVTNPTVNPA